MVSGHWVCWVGFGECLPIDLKAAEEQNDLELRPLVSGSNCPVAIAGVGATERRGTGG